jgi:hypothetical protein
MRVRAGYSGLHRGLFGLLQGCPEVADTLCNLASGRIRLGDRAAGVDRTGCGVEGTIWIEPQI